MDVEIVYGDEARIASKKRGICVVIDVLRASSTIINGLSNGALCYIPVLTVPNALTRKKEEFPDALLAGEREGFMVHGFDLGNSPFEHMSRNVNNREIIFTSSNCTRIVDLVLNSQFILIGTLINLKSLTEVVLHLWRVNHIPIFLIAVGNIDITGDEDLVVAKAIKQSLLGEQSINIRNVQNVIRTSPHAQILINKGFGNDVEFCSQFNSNCTVPIFNDIGFVKFSYLHP